MLKPTVKTSLTGLLCGLLMAQGANAVYNGHPDSSQHAVGGVGVDVDGAGPIPPFGICSGFVISDYAFVTAAHCIGFGAAFAASWVVTLEAGNPAQPVVKPGVFDGIHPNPMDFPFLVPTYYTARSVWVHPGFYVGEGYLLNDFAVLEFDRGTFDVPPVQIPEAGYMDGQSSAPQFPLMPVTLCGYGAEEELGNSLFRMPGYRKCGKTTVNELSETEISFGSGKAEQASTLAGDSGSPQFFKGWAVSITSSGAFHRLDTEAVLEFLGEFIGD